MLMFAWLSTAVAAPAFLAKRALRHGQQAMDRRNYDVARRHLVRAARHEPLREEAICLMAEVSLQDHRPSDALYALNTLLMEQEQYGHGPDGMNGRAWQGTKVRNRSSRVRLLRGIAGCVLGRPGAARRELAAISKSRASIDELLAAAQACVLSGDAGGARHLLDKLESESLAGELAARVRLCRAALYYRLSAWEKCLEALPEEGECSTSDRMVCARVRGQLRERLATVAPEAKAKTLVG